MKLINQTFNILTDFSVYDNKSADELKQIVFREIEVAGRTCYKSFDNIKEGSAEKFVNRMIKSGHNSMLESGTVYLDVTKHPLHHWFSEKYECNPYSFVNGYSITTNYRVLVENDWLDDLKYICSPTIHHEKRISVSVTTDRATANQLVRHRSMSFAQQSQRYCNFSKDKFGNEVSFIRPIWVDEAHVGSHKFEDLLNSVGDVIYFDRKYRAELLFLLSTSNDENDYFELLNLGLHQEQARVVLPNCTATELVITGFELDWIDLFKLRTDKSAQTEVRELASAIKEMMGL